MKTNATLKARKPPRYDAVASQYDSAMRPLERCLLARLRAKVFTELSGARRLLEVGAGTGANFSLYPNSACVTASELSTRMIEQARGKSSAKRVSIVQNCAEQLPFADDSFDAAVATLVFCSVDSPAEAFSELRRVVRIGGTIALLEHVRPGGLLGYLFDVLSVFTVVLFDDHFNRRTADDARRAGLGVLHVAPHAFGIFNVIVCRV
jgi:ubiquinone/menaquinone biosynthesis C-methylase UbiE